MNIRLLKDLNFTEIINGTNAVTEAGKDMLSNYRGYVYSNPVSCTVVNNFVHEASNFGFDTGLSAILESVTKFINENNISWKLASACESISNNTSSYGYLAKVGIEQVQKLLEMKENDVVSVRQKGKFRFGEVIKKTKKDIIKSVLAIFIFVFIMFVLPLFNIRKKVFSYVFYIIIFLSVLLLQKNELKEQFLQTVFLQKQMNMFQTQA